MGDNPKKIVPRMKDYEDDGPWMWVAFVPDCRLILDFVIGPRKQYIANKLVELINKHLSEKIPIFVTDGLKFFSESLNTGLPINKYPLFPKVRCRANWHL